MWKQFSFLQRRSNNQLKSPRLMEKWAPPGCDRKDCPMTCPNFSLARRARRPSCTTSGKVCECRPGPGPRAGGVRTFITVNRLQCKQTVHQSQSLIEENQRNVCSRSLSGTRPCVLRSKYLISLCSHNRSQDKCGQEGVAESSVQPLFT